MIYFAQAEGGGPIKVGFSVRPDLRIAQLSPALRLLNTRHGTVQDEHVLHERLETHRIDGEWYRPTPEVMAEVHAECDSTPSDTEEFDRALRRIWPLLIRAAYAGESALKISRSIGVTARTVENWRHGKAQPNMPGALAMGKTNPVINKFLVLMMTCDNPQAALAELEAEIQRLLQQRTPA